VSGPTAVRTTARPAGWWSLVLTLTLALTLGSVAGCASATDGQAPAGVLTSPAEAPGLLRSAGFECGDATAEGQFSYTSPFTGIDGDEPVLICEEERYLVWFITPEAFAAQAAGSLTGPDRPCPDEVTPEMLAEVAPLPGSWVQGEDAIVILPDGATSDGSGPQAFIDAFGGTELTITSVVQLACPDAAFPPA